MSGPPFPSDSPLPRLLTRLGRLPVSVWALGIASLLADVASEMIYPILPSFVTRTLRAGRGALGLIEGAADAVASLTKIASGLWTDHYQRRKAPTVAGYALSGIAKPLLFLAAAWPTVLILRLIDRLGKGVRTSPRDALIADVTPPEGRGMAYGVHRSMDHLGAVIGPIACWALLTHVGASVGTILLLSAIPALGAVLTVAWFVKEPATKRPSTQPFHLSNVGRLSPNFRRFLLAVTLFALGNSSDIFLLQRLEESGVAVGSIALLWALHHVVKSAVSFLGGGAADRFGCKQMILAGWTVYAVAYLGMGWGKSEGVLIGMFLLYGAFHGLSEPAEKSLVSQLAPSELRGTAFGAFHGAVGLAALPASLTFGLLWQAWGVEVAFGFGAGMAALGALTLMVVRPGRLSEGA